MVEGGGDLHLAQEPLLPHGGGQVGIEDLHRDLPVVPEVVGQVDRGHSARAEDVPDGVAVGQSASEIPQDVSHPGPPRWWVPASGDRADSMCHGPLPRATRAAPLPGGRSLSAAGATP